MVAQGPWASSKKVASTGPVPSSRVRNTTRRPERTGGVWVATLTPATRSSARLRRRSRSRLRVTPSASRNGSKAATACWLTSRPRISSSARIRSSVVSSGRPVGLSPGSPGSSPSLRVSWTESARTTGRAARDCAAARAQTPASASGCRSVSSAPALMVGSELLRSAAAAAVAAAAGGAGVGRTGPAAATRGAVDRAGVQVELGHLQQQVATGHPAASRHRLVPRPDPVDPVEAAGQHQSLEHRPGHPGAVEEVGQRDVGRAGPRLDDASHLGRADALDVAQREPDRVALTGAVALHDVRRRAGVDVEAEHAHPELAGVVEDQPLGIHAGVVGQHPRQEVGRPVRLEPGRLVGRQRERRRVGLAEAERSRRPPAPARPPGPGRRS